MKRHFLCYYNERQFFDKTMYLSPYVHINNKLKPNNLKK